MNRILKYQKHIADSLYRLLSDTGNDLPSDIPIGQDFSQRFSNFSSGGKFLRGSLVCHTYEHLSGRRPSSGVLEMASALELLHAGLLVHDDVMDHSSRRRGKPAWHVQYEQWANSQRLAKPAQFGLSMGVCSGDLSFFMVLAKLAPRPAVTELICRQLTTVCVGQMQDSYLQARPGNPTKAEIYAVMRAKTAGYSVALPLSLGAVLSNKFRPLRQLAALGETLGLLYQLRDDELDLFGSPQTGKPLGQDIREGKKNLVHYYLVRSCTPAQRQEIQLIYGRSGASEQEIARIRQIGLQIRVPQHLLRETKQFSKKACSQIDSLDISRQHKQELRALTTFCSTRQH